MKAVKANARMEKALITVRGLLPLPVEYNADIDDEKCKLFLARLSEPETSAEVIEMAHSLRGSELKYIFPSFTCEESNTNSKRLQDRLFLIIRERACSSMYNYAWLFFQSNPDNTALQKALSLLCSILEIKRETPKEFTVTNLITPVENTAEKQSTGTLPLISNLASPAHRQFIKRLSIVLAERRYELKSFFAEYGILPNSALAANLVSQSFLNRQHYTSKDKSLFRSSLQFASALTQGELVQSLLSACNELSPVVFHEYCRIIYQSFGTPEQGHVIWNQIREQEKRVYSRWVVRATIGSHCRQSPDKAKFYLRYIDSIERLQIFNQETILLFFDGFVIADNKNDLDSAMYYGRSSASAHPFDLAADDETHDPASTSVPHITCEQAIRQNDNNQNVILYYNHFEIKNTIAYMDFCLQNNRSAFDNIKRKFFS